MANKIPFCCPEPAIKNALHPHEIPNSSTKIPTTPGYACSNPLFVSVCAPTEPPEPITLDGQDCSGEALPASGNPGEIIQVVQAPGQVMTVRICEDDRDFELSCGVDPDTGHQIQTAYRIVNGEFELIKRWDTVTGEEWTGDAGTLEGCGGTKLEAEQEVFCDSGTNFLRWYTLKDGVPTGAFVDTDYTGAPYTVTDEATVTRGECVAETVQSVSSVTGDDISGLEPGTSFAVYKNECCSIKLTTSVGTIIIPKTATAYSTQIFKTEFTIDAVEVVDGTCDLATVTIISNLSV